MVTISVCGGMGCQMFGSEDTLAILKKELNRRGLNDRVELVQSFCMGGCSQGPCVRMNGIKHRQVGPDQAVEWLETQLLPLLEA